jgi:hypothetical protein
MFKSHLFKINLKPSSKGLLLAFAFIQNSISTCELFLETFSFGKVLAPHNYEGYSESVRLRYCRTLSIYNFFHNYRLIPLSLGNLLKYLYDPIIFLNIPMSFLAVCKNHLRHFVVSLTTLEHQPSST